MLIRLFIKYRVTGMIKSAVVRF